MRQEVRVTITLDADATLTKKQIEEYFANMIFPDHGEVNDSSRLICAHNIKVEEEKDIYGNDLP